MRGRKGRFKDYSLYRKLGKKEKKKTSSPPSSGSKKKPIKKAPLLESVGTGDKREGRALFCRTRRIGFGFSCARSATVCGEEGWLLLLPC